MFICMMCGPDLNRTQTHFQEKGDPCLLSDFANSCLNYIPIFQNFRYVFLLDFLQIWSTFQDFFCCCILRGGGSKWDSCLQTFFCVKFLHSGPLASCRGTQIILISSTYGMHSLETFATKLWKKLLERIKRHLFERLILAGTQEWRGTLQVPLSPGARGFAHPEPIGVTPLDSSDWLRRSHTHPDSSDWLRRSHIT